MGVGVELGVGGGGAGTEIPEGGERGTESCSESTSLSLCSKALACEANTAVTLSGLLWVCLRGIFKRDILIGCGCSGHQPLGDKAGRQGYKELFVRES